MVRDGQAALQRLSSLPHITSVAASLHRSGIIDGAKITAGMADAVLG